MLGAIKFRVERRVGDAEAVWRRLSRLEDMPKYWGGHRRVEVLGVNSGIYSLRITFAFPGPLNVGYAEAAVDEARREVLLNYVRGPFTGIVKNYVAGGVLASDWDIIVNALFIPLKPWISSHFRRGAEHALERLSGP
ncbi:MAG: SRPBCC family protein [Thermoproteus sp.]